MFKPVLFSAIFAIMTSGAVFADDRRTEFFEKRIRPILVHHCYECHGPDESSGKLRLDTKAGWARGGKSGPAIVPGDPSKSLVFRAVAYKDAKLKMPPPDSARKLSDLQISDLAKWIRDGAIDPRTGDPIIGEIEAAAKDHWAFQPIAFPKTEPTGHSVDFFIDQELKKRGFAATDAADMRTLIRRATYDLLGLPPTPEQLATSREKFPELVSSLLASPRYGERWGRHWLDVARYSDAKDGVLMYGDARIRPFAYTYRDYVIRAFNDDKPFDRFIREQLAADQMGLAANSRDLAAMGLLTLGRMFDSNPHDVIDDRIDVVTRGFLGLTVSCARCHDHKFDPIPTADYYSLYGVFASSVEPYDRPQIENVSETGKAYEKELSQKLKEVFGTQQRHYERTLETARNRTSGYLVQVATTKPDISETTIFFLSLLPGQLRPQITYKWRKLIARRAHPDDPVFGPWHDLMQKPVLQADRWRRSGVDERIINGLVAANPKTPAEVARAYGAIIRGEWGRGRDIEEQIAKVQADLSAVDGGAINLADIVAGGNGFGTGTKGAGIHPETGSATTGEAGFISIKRHDELIPVPTNKYVDGVFVPKFDTATISSTGIKITGIKVSSGQTWDYFKFGPSSGFTVNTIDGVDFNKAPNWMMAMHANKGITFDVQALRTTHEFQTARFKALFGHGGKESESQLDFAVYLDGKRVAEARDFQAQQSGKPIDVELSESTRFLTLIVTEGAKGISHDQAILGNPRIVPDKDQKVSDRKRQIIAALKQKTADLREKLQNLNSLEGDPLAELLLAKSSPVWFPRDKIYLYLSRKDKDAYRGLVNQIDAISVKHKSAAARAMVMVDSQSLYDPVIFQRGDPGHPGTPVPRQFLKIASGGDRSPFQNGSGRLDLATAIASPKNPLTARVWVNRVWMHHFGEPLVSAPSDFGLQTPRPVHHKLLDYLAATFIKSGWRTKPLHLLIMTSRAYQQASQIGETARMAKQLQSDPTNQLIWHANRRRLDLEQMRDTMLFISGRFDDTMFGRPPSITDPANRRRTVYAFVERQNIPNVIMTFDFANADTSTARRVTTTVPQQALFLMNSGFITETAKALAERTTGDSVNKRIEKLYTLTLGRSPSAQELGLGNAFVKTNSWEQYAQILLLTNEVMFVD